MQRQLSGAAQLITLAAALAIGALCPRAESASFELSSPAFAAGTRIPSQFTCKGADESPPLRWSGAPDETKALALIVEDPDAPGGVFVHWVAFNLPADSTGLPQGAPKTAMLPAGGAQGRNGFGRLGYNGPCPPPGPAHHYHFRLFALDKAVELGPGVQAPALRDAIEGHVKASADLVGIFGR
jgi:Raf kinase inhibitor-like YbhB/YbcL family protein